MVKTTRMGLTLDQEVARLFGAMGPRIDGKTLQHETLEGLLKGPRTDKLRYIAHGVRRGWYGDRFVSRRILGGLYSDVCKFVNN